MPCHGYECARHPISRATQLTRLIDVRNTAGRSSRHVVAQVTAQLKSRESHMSVNPAPTTDEERLAELGYQQELHRRLSGFSNFAVSFSIISILAGAITSY